MKNNYIFKKATVRDLDNLFKFFPESLKRQFPEYSLKTRNFFVEKEWSASAVKAQMQGRQIIIYLAFYHKEVIGYLIVRSITGGVCLGNWLAVSPSHQNKGVATGLLEMWEKDAKIAGFHKLHLWTDKRNLGFYKNKGFQFVGKIPQNYYGADDYLFYKTLQKPQEKNYLK